MASGSGQRRRRNPQLRLIELRVNRGLSREDLARLAGVSRETIRLVEDGFVPTPRTQFALAQVFGLMPLDIWTLHQQKAVRP